MAAVWLTFTWSVTRGTTLLIIHYAQYPKYRQLHTDLNANKKREMRRLSWYFPLYSTTLQHLDIISFCSRYKFTLILRFKKFIILNTEKDRKLLAKIRKKCRKGSHNVTLFILRCRHILLFPFLVVFFASFSTKKYIYIHS